MEARIDRRRLLLGAGFAATAGLAAAVTPRRHEATIGGARLTALIPAAVGPWRFTPGGSLIVPEDGQRTSFYDQVLTRTYAAPGLPEIMLLVAYGAAQSGMMKVHRPEVCYASAGFTINDVSHPMIRLRDGEVPATLFLARRQDRDEQVLYWTRISDTFPRSLNDQRLAVLERGLTGVIPDGVLVRFSTLAGDVTAGRAAMAGFARALVAGAAGGERSLLVGRLKPLDRA